MNEAGKGNVSNPEPLIGTMAKCGACKGCRFFVGGNVFETPYDKAHCLKFPESRHVMKPDSVLWDNKPCRYFEPLWKSSAGIV